MSPTDELQPNLDCTDIHAALEWQCHVASSHVIANMYKRVALTRVVVGRSLCIPSVHQSGVFQEEEPYVCLQTRTDAWCRVWYRLSYSENVDTRIRLKQQHQTYEMCLKVHQPTLCLVSYKRDRCKQYGPTSKQFTLKPDAATRDV